MTLERRSFSAQRVVGKWLGTFAGPAAWFTDQQLVAATVYAACPAHSLAFVAGVGAGCALLALAGVLVSWRVRQGLPPEELASASARTDRFVATLSLFVAGLSLLAIVFATAAALFLRCERF